MTNIEVTFLAQIVIWTAQTMKSLPFYWRYVAPIAKIAKPLPWTGNTCTFGLFISRIRSDLVKSKIFTLSIWTFNVMSLFVFDFGFDNWESGWRFCFIENEALAALDWSYSFDLIRLFIRRQFIFLETHHIMNKFGKVSIFDRLLHSNTLAT